MRSVGPYWNDEHETAGSPRRRLAHGQSIIVAWMRRTTKTWPGGLRPAHRPGYRLDREDGRQLHQFIEVGEYGLALAEIAGALAQFWGRPSFYDRPVA